MQEAAIESMGLAVPQGVFRKPLEETSVGHYKLNLPPTLSACPRRDAPWRRLGPGGAVEVPKFRIKDMLQRKLDTPRENTVNRFRRLKEKVLSVRHVQTCELIPTCTHTYEPCKNQSCTCETPTHVSCAANHVGDRDTAGWPHGLGSGVDTWPSRSQDL